MITMSDMMMLPADANGERRIKAGDIKLALGAVRDAKVGFAIPLPMLNKEQLQAIKAALESVNGSTSDFVQQSHLKLLQLMQNFNTAFTIANNIQSMNAESNKSIA